MRDSIRDILISTFMVFIALLIGAVIILLLGQNPIEAYSYMFQGAFVGKRAIAKTLMEATPLIFTGLAVAFAFKAGLFNIGAQGQIIAGGLVAGIVGAYANTIFINNVFVVLAVAGLAGFCWAGIAGFLKSKYGVHEVISTIMLNYIAMSFEGFVLNSSLKADGYIPQTPPVHEASRLLALMPSTHVPLNFGFIIAVIAVFIVWYVLKKTIFGYEVRAVGHNPSACESAGINVKWKIITILGISGLLAGLGGGVRVVGGVCQYTYLQGIMAEYGFDGIAVALLGKTHPVGVLVSAILFSALRVGGQMMQFQTEIPSQIVMMIQAIIILLIAAENIFRYMFRSRKSKKIYKSMGLSSREFLKILKKKIKR